MSQQDATPGEDYILEMDGIHKRFGEIVALRDVDFRLRRGEIQGLAGDNGAGKSTLIKCLAGVHAPDEGRILFNGAEVSIEDPMQAQKMGIETTYQELALAPNLNVAENIFLGREKTKSLLDLLHIRDKKAMVRRTEELMDTLDIDIDPTSRVSNLSGGQRQLVAISRTMLTDPEIIIMDEPTSALSVEAARHVLELIERLRDQGASIILISHNFEHMREVADRISVLYTGQNAGTIDASEATQERIVELMISGGENAESASAPA